MPLLNTGSCFPHNCTTRKLPAAMVRSWPKADGALICIFGAFTVHQSAFTAFPKTCVSVESD